MFWYDRNNLRWFYTDKNGKNKIYKFPLELYINPKDKRSVRKFTDICEQIWGNTEKRNWKNQIDEYDNTGKYTDIFGNKLTRIRFKRTDSNVTKFKKLLKELFNEKVQIYGTSNVDYGFILDESIEFNDKRRIWFYDIEIDNFSTLNDNTDDYKIDVMQPLRPILSITIYDTMEDKYWILTLKDKLETNKEYETMKYLDNVDVYLFKTEKDLLKVFVKFMRKYKPDLLTGWYSESFDTPYIINRIKLLFGEKSLNGLTTFDKPRKGLYSNVYKKVTRNEIKFYNTIVGLETVDYLDIYKKFSGKNPPSYGLDSVAEYENLGITKTEKKGFMYFFSDFDKYIDYIFRDVELLVKLDEKLKLMNMLIGLQNLLKIPFNSLFMTSFVVTDMIYKILIKEHKILKSYTVEDIPNMSYQGAIVLDPEDTRYYNLVVLDFASLYPNTIRTLNISPELLIKNINNVKKMDEKNIPYVDLTDMFNNGEVDTTKERVTFRLDKKGILPKVIDILITERLRYKKLMKQEKDPQKKLEYNLKQWNYKIILNSVYGYLGYKYSLLFDPLVAGSVTSGARFMLLSAKDIVDNKTFYVDSYNTILLDEKEYKNTHDKELKKSLKKIKTYVKYGDTDSIFIVRDDWNNKELDLDEDTVNKFGELLKEYTNKKLLERIFTLTRNYTIDELKERNTEELDVDKLFKIVRFFGVKKRYYGLDFKGKELYHGIELVRSDTPKGVKSILSDLFRKSLLEYENLSDEVLQYYEGIQKMKLDEIGTPKSISKLNMNDYKVIPNHVRGYNVTKKLIPDIEDVPKDKVIVVPITVKKEFYEIDSDTYMFIKETFNVKKKRNDDLNIVFSFVKDDLEYIEEFLDKNNKYFSVNYLEIFEKQIIQKLKQFSDYEKDLVNIINSLKQKTKYKDKLTLFDMGGI